MVAGWRLGLRLGRGGIAVESSLLDRDRRVIAADRSSKKKMGSRNGQGDGNGGRAKSLERGVSRRRRSIT
ncbi:hypothetical protein AAC387_Pa03g0493 [Persea americana]